MLVYLTEEEYEIHKKMCQLRYVMKESFDRYFWNYHGAESIMNDKKLVEKIEFSFQKYKHLIDKEIWVKCHGLNYFSINELDIILFRRFKYYEDKDDPENEKMKAIIQNFYKENNKNDYFGLTPDEKASLFDLLQSYYITY